MKASHQIIGLPVISAQEGIEAGNIKELLIDPQKRAVRFAVVDDGQWYFGANIVDISDILGIGDDAIVIKSRDAIKKITEVEEAVRLVKVEPPLLGQIVMTHKGKIVGTVEEYFVHEDNGHLLGCRIQSSSETEDADFVPDDNILTYGTKAVVIKLPHEEESAAEERQPEVEIGQEAAASDGKEQYKNVFIERQKAFLIGRRVTKDINDMDGKIIISKDTMLDEEIIEIAAQAGKLVELTMNSRP
ncbi:PRC-barrel domain-containing protein [Mahella australiensis]|uniref:PRC-barrel domain protein n=1 Tax=Mahella australiensis (strain DSM 15567 / CIP 107919 / 50-1 BON) TaxID=697281 RepID=F3ZY66_MAHA5|nr:PRC-barrel domain-containing protein [Mahella australiensis]AEE95591.1 PRC-barrel domain protein [Mahella australiensis 50-1 BON]